MGENIKGVNIPSRIVPYSPNDTYPTHEAIYGKGGWKCVDSISGIATIPVERLEVGCIVRVNNPTIEYSYTGERASDEELSKINLEEDPSDENIAKFGFVKWTPGYQPKSLSELDNDVPFIAEVVEKTEEGENIYLDPDDVDDSTKIQGYLLDRFKGIYQELAISYLYRNSYRSSISDNYSKPVRGLVTVGPDDKIPSELVEDGGKYVETLVGFFPDDWITDDDDSAYSWPKPPNMQLYEKYYVTTNYLKDKSSEESEDVRKFRNKICTVTNDGGTTLTWVGTDPEVGDFIYINEGTQSLYVFGEKYINDPKCVGRELIRDINILRNADVAENKWNELSVSANLIYELLKDTTTGNGEINKVLLSQLTDIDLNCTPNIIERKAQSNIEVTWNINYNNNKLVPLTLKLISNTQGTPITTDKEATNATVNVPSSFSSEAVTITLSITMDYGASKTITKTINTYYPCYFGYSTNPTGSYDSAISFLDGKKVLESPKGNYSMEIPEGNYVWLYVPEGMVINEVTSCGVKVPFMEKSEISVANGKYFGYRSVEKFKAGTFNYTIN